MKPSNIFSKYQCDDKLKIYSEVPLNNRQYKKMISNAKSRYMNDYYNTPRYNPKKDEKTFNNLLNSYYTDFNKLKKKYNFIEDEQDYEEEEEEQNNNVESPVPPPIATILYFLVCTKNIPVIQFYFILVFDKKLSEFFRSCHRTMSAARTSHGYC